MEMDKPATQPSKRGTGLTAMLRSVADSRDSQAWLELLECQGPAIQALARRISGDASLAEDICQETLLQIRDDAGQFKPQGADADEDARRWIARVTCHTALQMLRARKRAAKREERFRREQGSSPQKDSSMQSERIEDIRSEVENLPERERAPIVMHFFAGMDYQALSAELGCPVGTAKARNNGA